MQTDKKVTVMLKTDLKFKVRFLKEEQANAVNIQSVDAYFINRSLRERKFEEQKEFKKHFKFLRRYPIEPCVNDLHSTICCLNNPGIYGYNTRPVGICAPVYAGFGVEPCFGHHCHGHHHHYDCLHHDAPGPHVEGPEVIKAPIFYTADRMAVEVYFPAWLQKVPGEYDLVMTIVMYDNKYCLHNARTITISYESLVTLTETSDSYPNIEIIPDDVPDDEEPEVPGGDEEDPNFPEDPDNPHMITLVHVGGNCDHELYLGEAEEKADNNNIEIEKGKKVKVVMFNATKPIVATYVNGLYYKFGQTSNGISTSFLMPATNVTLTVVYQGDSQEDTYVTAGRVKQANGNNGTTIELDLNNTESSDDVSIDISSIADWYEGA